MSIRNVFASVFLIGGCAAAVLIVTAMAVSMQLDTGPELFLAIAGLGGAALSLLFGTFILFYRR